MISGVYYFAFSRIAVGLVATVISGQIKHLLWSLLMVVVGVIAYMFEPSGSLWLYGPVLVVLAGIIGVVTHVL